MANAFAVAGPTAPVALDLARRGRCTISVRNLLSRALQVRLQIARSSQANPAWLRVAGEAVAQFAPGETRQFQMEIAVPAAAAPGAYSFVPEAVSVTNPDDENAAGAPVTFRVEASPIPKPKGRGYLATLAGAMTAALAAALVGTLPGSLLLIFLATPAPNEDWSHFIGRVIAILILPGILLALGLFVGLWVGPPVGAWIALRFRNYPGAGWTAGALAVLQPVWVVVLVLFTNAVLKKVSGPATILLVIVLYLLATAVPPWPARALVVFLQSRKR